MTPRGVPGPIGDLYGVAEIADELGVSRVTVAQWLKRGKMPAPDARLAMGPVWKARTIRPWIKRKTKEG